MELIPPYTIIPNSILYHLYTAPLLSENNYQGIWEINANQYFSFIITHALLCNQLNTNLKEHFSSLKIKWKNNSEISASESREDKLQKFEQATGISFQYLITLDSEIAFKKGGLITPVMRLKSIGSKEYYRVRNKVAAQEFSSGNYKPRKPGEDYLVDIPRGKDENGNRTGFVDEEYMRWDYEHEIEVSKLEKDGIPVAQFPLTKFSYIRWVKSISEECTRHLPYLNEFYMHNFPNVDKWIFLK